MSFLSNVESLIQKDEAWVIQLFATVKADVAVAEQDIINVLQWLSAHGQEIATDVAGVLAVVAAAGVGVPAPVLTAATALNAAVAAVNSAVAAQQQQAASGASQTGQVVAAASAAYQSLKAAQIATSTAQAQVAKPST